MAENPISIKQIFWTNVDWHRKNKGFTWTELVGGNTRKAMQGTSNLTLEKVEEIAELLDIDDYAILFEEVERTEINDNRI